MSRFAPLAILFFTVLIGTTIWCTEPFSTTAMSNLVEKRSALNSSHSGSKTSPESNLTSQASPTPTDSQLVVEESSSLSPHGAEIDEEPQTADDAQKISNPRAVVEETVHNFGVLPRFTQSHHEFIIRNEGQAPLKLKQGPSSCSCTILGIDTSEIAPNESAKIRLEWTLKFKEGPFHQSATILTNDPDNKEITFAVKGLTETRLGLSEPSVTFSAMSHGDELVRDVLLYSQTWNRLENVNYDVKSYIPGMQVEILPASSEEVESHQVRSAKKIRIRLPNDLEPGHHVGQIIFSAEPPDLQTVSDGKGNLKDRAKTALTVEAQLRKPGVKFFSPLIDGYGCIKLGVVDAKTGSDLIKLNFRVDQGETIWHATEIAVFPESLKAQVVPLNEEIGLFQLQIQIPAGSPTGNYYGRNIGKIILNSDHPLLPRIPSNRPGILVEFGIQ
ncbi:DUF1573 domain-containing protein [Bremerella sp. JC770]|uniref:DUF1573 domain-containing protein n=1 Tax=Bremerella sp. JC770 TaxID=3232137 RepID=UPI003457BD42